MSQKINRVGETVLTSCGLNATIIEYRNANDLDIQFEDGSCRQNITYSVFKTGQIKHPDRTAEKRLNETMQMKNGQMATIINYRSATDIDIKFEDGVIVTNKTYGQFKRKEIRNPYIFFFRKHFFFCSFHKFFIYWFAVTHKFVFSHFISLF